MQLTEHQIEGSKLLREIEGIDNDIGEVLCERDYLHDWNDLLRVAQVLFSKEFKFFSEEWQELRRLEEHFFVSVSNYSKEQAFIVLVEAAKWIKQNQK